MLIKFILAIALIAFIFWWMSRWKRLPDDQRRSFLLKALIYGAFFVCLLAVLTGRAHWLTAVFTGMLAAAKFGLRALPFVNVLRRGKLFNNPVFNTPFLKAELDLQNGQIFGTITEGPLKGSELSSLNKEDFEILENHYRQHDKASYYLICVIRQRGGARQQRQERFESTGDPSLEEARLILGLEPSPTREQVVSAHRTLIQKLHPDRGGNDYLASRVNLAKDVLLKHLDDHAKH